MPKRVARLVSAILLAIGVSACGSRFSHAAEFGGLSGEQSFPDDSLTDWVSLADQISVVRVVSDAPIPPPVPPATSGGYQGRRANFVVERTLWHAAGVTPKTEFSMVVAGWFTSGDGDRQEACVEDDARIEVGDRYVFPLTHYEDGTLTSLASGSLLPLNKVRGLGRFPDKASGQLKGLTFDEMAARLADTPMDPIAKKYEDLTPYDRGRKMIEERYR
ncbi:MAG TPA: hypothetical protein VJ831_00915 [Jatrophihabitantaceae bacterium]|nr:hypothetical protein [Jatrophihabitantaceae bacterium]